MFVGIDTGGTNTRIVTSESLDEVAFKCEVSINTNQEYTEGEKSLVEAIRGITKNISAIGIGLPGSIDEQGVLDGSTNLPDWVGKPLKQKLEEAFDCNVFIKNDAEIGALGEAQYGSEDKDDFLYLTWGTGLGVAQIKWQDGKPQVSRPANRQSIYDLEAMVGGKDIEAKFSKKAAELTDEEWNAVVDSLYSRLPALAHEYGFNSFVIGGGIAGRKKELLKIKVGTLRGIEVRITNLEGKAGLYGALALCKNINV
jgi:hypothetical protein